MMTAFTHFGVLILHISSSALETYMQNKLQLNEGYIQFVISPLPFN